METGEMPPLEPQPSKELLAYQPKISVVVPVLNRVGEIPQLLKSIKQQIYQGEIEVIVADGGSTDGTIETCKAAGATVILAPKGTSIGATARAGCEAATGEILVYTGSDFILSDNFLGEVARAFSDPEVIASYGPIEFVYQGKPPEGLINKIIQWQFEQDLKKRQRKGQPMLISFAILKSVYDILGGFDPRTHRIEEPVIYQLLWEMPGKIAFVENQKSQTELPWQKKARPSLIKYLQYQRKNKTWVPTAIEVIQERKRNLPAMKARVEEIIQERKHLANRLNKPAKP